VSELERFLDQLALDGPLEPFLVFADWLQDRGDPWGELIAMQCQTTEEVAKKKELGLSSLRLLDQLADRLCPHHSLVGIAWKRGFVQFIGFSDAETERWLGDELARLFAEPATALCSELTLAGAHLDDAHAVALVRHQERLRRIARVDLRGNWFSPSVTRNLESLFPGALLGDQREAPVSGGERRAFLRSWGGPRSPEDDR
jgi:hypothetical protein